MIKCSEVLTCYLQAAGLGVSTQRMKLRLDVLRSGGDRAYSATEISRERGHGKGGPNRESAGARIRWTAPVAGCTIRLGVGEDREETMIEASDLRMTRIPLNHGTGHIPALGFGTLIPDAAATITATRDALEAGFRHFDCAERYRNEREVGEALQAGLAAGGLPREDTFVTTKLWNNNHRPVRVEPAFEASLDRLRLKYLDLYLIHTPFAFQPGDEQDPRDQNGNVLYDHDVTLHDTWKAMETVFDHGKCRAIGLSDITLDKLRPIYESARIKPAVVQVEAHPYLPETELLEYCTEKSIVFLAFAPLGHGINPGPLEDPVILAIAARVAKTPAQVLLSWAVQRGTALLTTPKSAARAKENFNISPLPQDAFEEINRIQTRQRLNDVINTGTPGFIPRGSQT